MMFVPNCAFAVKSIQTLDLLYLYGRINRRLLLCLTQKQGSCPTQILLTIVCQQKASCVALASSSHSVQSSNPGPLVQTGCYFEIPQGAHSLLYLDRHVLVTRVTTTMAPGFSFQAGLRGP